MAINQLIRTTQTAEMSEADIEKTVMATIGSLKCNAREFEHAKITYNSDFFKDEAPEFKAALCKALHTFFEPVGVNQFWKKAGA
jgi:hypothetical protein